MSEMAAKWNLESFLDSLILELDKAQDTLSLKGVTRKLTYTVQDVSLDLQIFPSYEDGQIRFTAARPGDAGASRLSLQLGSITDRQIKETTTDPIDSTDVAIDGLDELDKEFKDSLKKVGVHSAKDLEKLERRKVDIEKVMKDKTGKEVGKSYTDLANLINKARRKRIPPSVASIKSVIKGNKTELQLNGKHLALAQGVKGFPMALLNDQSVNVTESNDHHLTLAVANSALQKGENKLQVALDPYALMVLNINA